MCRLIQMISGLLIVISMGVSAEGISCSSDTGNVNDNSLLDTPYYQQPCSGLVMPAPPSNSTNIDAACGCHKQGFYRKGRVKTKSVCSINFKSNGKSMFLLCKPPSPDVSKG